MMLLKVFIMILSSDANVMSDHNKFLILILGGAVCILKNIGTTILVGQMIV